LGRLAKKFDFLAELSSLFPDDEKPILVGGSAVEFYTRGISRSIDLDLVDEKNVLPDILKRMGFKREGRHYYKDRIYIEIPSSFLRGRAILVKYKGKKIRIISVEDLIIDRLCACIYWDSPSDCEQARMLISGYKNKLDKQYLFDRAEKEYVISELKRMWEIR
jgi:hypothetical protein